MITQMVEDTILCQPLLEQHDWWMMPQAYLSQIGTTNDNGIRAVIEIDK